MPDPPAVPPPGAPFPTTRWSRVAAAGGPGDREALAELCAAYWFPVYAFVRRKGYDAERALDLTQGYFACALSRNSCLKKSKIDRSNSRLLPSAARPQRRGIDGRELESRASGMAGRWARSV